MTIKARRSTSRSRSESSKNFPQSAGNDLPVERKFTPEKDTWNGHYEFGGWLSVFCIMLVSHVIVYYLYVCIEKFQGTIIYPGHPLLNGDSMLVVFWRYLSIHAAPTWETFGVFTIFLLLEYILAVVLPALKVEGLPIASENGYRFIYNCNALYAWYCLLIILGLLHYTDVFPLWKLRDQYGHYLTAGNIWADIISIWIYFEGLRRPLRLSKSIIYDFFMGTALNFRLPGNVDLKLFAECRNSWVLLMIITLGNASAMYREIGYITGNMWFIIFAQFLYVNAIQKGEECIISSWDIFYEKFGWMLAYWNTCGVPFLYTLQSLYIQTVLKERTYKSWQLCLMFIILLLAYCIWDSANAQKNRFRMKRNGSPDYVIHRKSFPQVPWSYIENPCTLKGERGELFVDGWYKFGRKIHYTMDIIMAFLWGASCGFDSFIPFFYVSFFSLFLIHRGYRDDLRCREKYGELWDTYVKLVPYMLIPGIY